MNDRQALGEIRRLIAEYHTENPKDKYTPDVLRLWRLVCHIQAVAEHADQLTLEGETPH